MSFEPIPGVEFILEFTVPMTPVAKGRPRFSGSVVYTPQETVLFESAFIAFSRKYKPPQPLEIPIFLELEFHFLKPKSSKRKFHTVRPDNDNLQKAVQDSMNKIFWHDDAQVVRVTSTKYYSEKEFIKVIIREFSGQTK